MLAAVKNGVTPVWASEIEKFPIAVTKHHFPNIKHLGDITKINGAEIDPTDIICAGSPCQNLSVAGNRKGLQGSESSLFHESIRVLREMKKATNGQYPKYFVWENVPGAFSSNKGDDFRTVLEEITETNIPMPKSGRWAKAGLVRSNKCEVAWRTLDAQYWGVPQRRKRIFLVADFGGQSAGEILFESESLYWNSPKSKKKGQGVAGNTGTSTEDTGRLAIYDMTHADEVMRAVTGGKTQTLNARMGTGGNQVPVIFKTGVASKGRNACVRTFSDKASTLRTSARFPKNASDAKGMLVYSLQGSMIGRGNKNGPQGSGINKDVCFTLNTVDRHAIYQTSDLYCSTTGSFMKAEREKAQTLLSRDYKDPQIVNLNKAIRRLTPLECERLQGLPDLYTFIDDKLCSDSARYKAIGNGMAQPCADFVIGSIVLNENEMKGMI